MTKPLRTQFIVADGTHSRWVRRAETADDFVTVREIKTHTFAGGHGHVAGDHDVAAFARSVAEAINAEAQAGHDDRFAVIAPTRTLAAILADLTPVARAKIRRTLAKDLAGVPDHALGEWLRPLELG